MKMRIEYCTCVCWCGWLWLWWYDWRLARIIGPEINDNQYNVQVGWKRTNEFVVLEEEMEREREKVRQNLGWKEGWGDGSVGWVDWRRVVWCWFGVDVLIVVFWYWWYGWVVESTRMWMSDELNGQMCRWFVVGWLGEIWDRLKRGCGCGERERTVFVVDVCCWWVLKKYWLVLILSPESQW